MKISAAVQELFNEIKNRKFKSANCWQQTSLTKAIHSLRMFRKKYDKFSSENYKLFEAVKTAVYCIDVLIWLWQPLLRSYVTIISKVKSMQRSRTESIRTQIQPSKPKREITKITNSENTKKNI